MKTVVTHQMVTDRARLVASRINRMHATTARPLLLYGVPRGGVPAAYAVMAALHEMGTPAMLVNHCDEAHVVIDDLIDSGATMQRFPQSIPFMALFDKKRYDDDAALGWLVFPWEGDEVGSAGDIGTRLLQLVGEDVRRGGLRETPARFIKAMQEYTHGYSIDPASLMKTFDDGAESYDELVIVRDIPFYSLCEHHMAPFFGTASIGYIPQGKVVGLSKLARVVDAYARRLQVQERLTTQVGTLVEQTLNPRGVGVIIRARHMCMEARGACKPGAETVTSYMGGALRVDPSARAEFLRLVGG